MKLENLSHSNRSILLLLKRQGALTMAQLAHEMKVTKEAVRQQLLGLHRQGWVEKEVLREAKVRSGRPTVRYGLTPLGDHFFPKDYDALAAELLETIGRRLGPPALRRLLSDMTETRVRKWRPVLEGKPLRDKVNCLKDLYLEKDPFLSVTETADGFRMVEGNCPFLNVASRQPALCSVSVSVLTQLLGVKVVREERFQSGDGRCVFHVYKHKPVKNRPASFQLEPEAGKA
ncbi:MAG TPA: DNA-binding protein [bacterium]|nr:DNA-binding protein [bacterium]